MRIYIFLLSILCMSSFIKSNAMNRPEFKQQNFIESSAWVAVSKNEKIEKYCADCRQNAQTENTKIPEKQEGILRLVTYNVHFWKTPDCRQDNLHGVLSSLKDINADIILLQEYNNRPDAIACLKQMGYLYGYDSFGYKFQRGNHSYGEIILSKKRLQAVKVSPGIKGQYHGFSRIELRVNNKIIAVYGTHTNVYKVNQRRREIENLLQAVAQDSADYTVLGADWNAIRQDDYSFETWNKLRIMYQKHLGYDTVPLSELQQVTDAGFIDSFTATLWPKPRWTVWNGTMIDFWFIKSKQKTPVIGSWVYYTAASDHLPIIMDIAVTIQARL